MSEKQVQYESGEWSREVETVDTAALIAEARAHAGVAHPLLRELADELESALDAKRLSDEAFAKAIEQRDEAAAKERARIAAAIWTEEQKAGAVLRAAPAEKIGTPEYADIASRIVGLQRARDIALGEGPKP